MMHMYIDVSSLVQVVACDMFGLAPNMQNHDLSQYWLIASWILP